MQKLKTVLLAFFFGVVLGHAIADVAAPGILTWYNIPGGGGALCNCADVVRSTAESIIHAHWIGGGVVGVLFMLIAIFTGGGQKAAASAPTPPA